MCALSSILSRYAVWWPFYWVGVASATTDPASAGGPAPPTRCGRAPQARVVAEHGPHITDPYTGQPAAGLASVAVVGTRLAAVDAYATAAFAMGLQARDWVESLNGCEAFGITLGGAALAGQGFGAYLGWLRPEGRSG